VYVGLKERKYWRSGVTKEQIGAEIGAGIEAAVPEVAGAISQPIQMRTNELVAGVRSDVAALLYGPDLGQLQKLGEVIAAAVRKVPGAEDVQVEQVAGLRYLRIEPDRNKLARYGLTVADINQLTETIAVGHHVGDVLEGERRFEIAVKTAHEYAGDLGALEGLPLKALSGQTVPLGDVATLSFSTGPAQISREAQSRRLTVEFNVRGRDLLSVVHDVKDAVARASKLPLGYRVEWGGQFEHYEDAKDRLLIVVPLALALILFLLWLALGSTTRALLIFLNVPFATIGGVIALWARGIPFSVSTGVGFIALFGVAVLNGLVLVTFAEQLERTGVRPAEAIAQAATLRLRPVLMTALVASLGFLPMALSSAPGSEVQRPLATVVVGGLVTATLLTLLVLPAAYALVTRRRAH
jgi:heavy metal efflux system protein